MSEANAGYQEGKEDFLRFKSGLSEGFWSPCLESMQLNPLMQHLKFYAFVVLVAYNTTSRSVWK